MGQFSGFWRKVRQSQVTPGRQRRWGHHRSPPFHEAAQTKVQRLEAALAAFGEEDSPEKDVLKGFLARAVEQAKVKPVDVRIKSRESDLPEMHETTRGGQGIRQELRGGGCQDPSKMEADLQPPEPRVRQEEVESEVVRLRKQVSELQQKFRPPHPVQGSEEAYENLRKRAAKRRVCPDRPPCDEQDLEVWMSDKKIWNSGTHGSLGTRHPFRICQSCSQKGRH